MKLTTGTQLWLIILLLVMLNTGAIYYSVWEPTKAEILQTAFIINKERVNENIQFMYSDIKDKYHVELYNDDYVLSEYLKGYYSGAVGMYWKVFCGHKADKCLVLPEPLKTHVERYKTYQRVYETESQRTSIKFKGNSG